MSLFPLLAGMAIAAGVVLLLSAKELEEAFSGCAIVAITLFLFLIWCVATPV